MQLRLALAARVAERDRRGNAVTPQLAVAGRVARRDNYGHGEQSEHFFTARIAVGKRVAAERE